MTNLNFLKAILMSTDEYWVVAKKNEYHNVVDRGRRDKDSVILTVIPYSLNRGVPESEILLCEIEKLRSSELINIHINESYAPFQHGMSFYDIYTGYPIKGDVKEFLIKALELKSNSIHDYEALAKSDDCAINTEIP